MEGLSEEIKQEIAASTEPASELSEKYGISIETIESLRTFSSDFDEWEAGSQSSDDDIPETSERPNIFEALSLKLKELIMDQEREVSAALEDMTQMILEKGEHVRRKIEMCDQIVSEKGIA